MKLEHQVVSLELSKRLKELGVKQESYFVRKKLSITGDFPDRWNLGRYTAWHNMPGIDLLSAFTVAELGEMLKEKDWASDDQLPYFWERERQWLAGVYERDDDWESTSDTEADARAKMLIYLLENKLINL